ncbi:MAG: Rpn family recombination-promoting nuclease/putative transposase [Lachnospiraceae bacterium]
MADTNLAQAVEATHDSSSYDTNVKFLLADKQILSRILKYAVQEFKDMPIEDIMSSIGEDIEIGTKPLDAGLSNMGRINASSTEDNIPGEGKIFFDIRFTAYHKEMEMKFLINVEAQKSSEPAKLGYHLENRIIFYLARMISAQKQTEFFHSDYDNLKKVRSIWICMDNSEDGDSIEEINLGRNTVFGNKVNPSDVDLMRGIIINVRSGNNIKDSQNALISMLEKLLSQTSVGEKKRILTEEYGMIMTTELEGRIQTMCNLSENIKEQSVKTERLNAIERMIKAGAKKEQIISFGYTEEEFAEAENFLCANA